MNTVYKLLVLTAAAVLAACGTTGAIAPSAPAWVNKGSGAFAGESGKAFYGVGGVSGVKNKPLALTAADNRARAELARIFEYYSASLMRDYARATTAGDMTRSAEEQDVQNAVKTFSAATLSGVMIVDRWQDPVDGTVYSLARLDIESFKANLDQARELNAAVREYVRANAERAFERLEAEEAKRGK